MASDLVRAMRPACSQCGRAGLEWMTAAQLIRRLDTATGREAARHAVMAFGSGADCWLCPSASCAEWGVFGPLEEVFA